MLVEEQFGFTKNITTEKATCELSNEIVRMLLIIDLLWEGFFVI